MAATTNNSNDNNNSEPKGDSIIMNTNPLFRRERNQCIFYDLQHSNNAARIRLWLRLKGLTNVHPIHVISGNDAIVVVETRMLSMADLQSPEYATINPCRKVPALITDTGMTLFEASVILNYLEDKYGTLYPQPNLVLNNCNCDDDTPEDRALVNLMVRCHDLYIASPNCTQPNFSHTQGCMYLDPTPTRFTPARRTMTASTRAAKLAELYQQLQWLESHVQLDYLASTKQLTHADLTWFPTLVFMEFMLPKSFDWPPDLFMSPKYLPRISQWYHRVQHTCQYCDEFERVRKELLDDLETQYQQGRLAGVKEDIRNHPALKWNYF